MIGHGTNTAHVCTEMTVNPCKGCPTPLLASVDGGEHLVAGLSHEGGAVGASWARRAVGGELAAWKVHPRTDGGELTELQTWLKSLGLAALEGTFKDQGIDTIHKLHVLEGEDLIELGVPAEQCAAVLQSIDEWDGGDYFMATMAARRCVHFDAMAGTPAITALAAAPAAGRLAVATGHCDGSLRLVDFEPRAASRPVAGSWCISACSGAETTDMATLVAVVRRVFWAPKSPAVSCPRVGLALDWLFSLWFDIYSKPQIRIDRARVRVCASPQSAARPVAGVVVLSGGRLASTTEPGEESAADGAAAVAVWRLVAKRAVD